ncbi:hypothetical protein ZWY2020_041774 [Hordeum vulgare]|nr:hypothetical protein ZWY2020_041774 [Hordeum vulgare]
MNERVTGDLAGVRTMDGKKQRSAVNLPLGYHFAPTDEELIVHYLRRKMDGHPPHLPIFKDVPVIHYRPEQITEEFRDSGEDRWYFFTKRTRKYATGSRPDRTTPAGGYWKATGPQKDIFTGGKKQVGRRRALVFYYGPDHKTDWSMYEYENITSEQEAKDKNVDKLGEWVLCTIQRQKTQPAGSDGDDTMKGGGRKRKGKNVVPDKADGRKRKGKDVVPDKAGGRKRKGKDVVPEMSWPEEGDETGMLELEQASSPNKRLQIMQQHDEPPPPCPQTMMSAQDCDYGPGIVPPSQEPPPPPPPCPETMVPAQDCDYGPGIVPPSQEPPPPPPPCPKTVMPAQDCDYGFDHESMLLLLQFQMTPPVLGVGYDNYGMTGYQPATSYVDDAAGPLGAFSYGGSGAAHQPAGHLNYGGYAGGHPGGLLGTCNNTYTYPQYYSYAGMNQLVTSSNSTYTYQQQHSHAAGTNKLAPGSSTYTYQQQHAHTTADGTSNSTNSYQQQQSCAAGANKLALVMGAMSIGTGQGSDVQPQVEL